MKILTRVLIGMIVIIGFTSTCNLVEAKTVRIDEARVRVSLNPGESYTGAINITNPTEEMSTVQVYPEDWIYEPSGKGNKTFFPPGTIERSASTWISYNPAVISVPPFGKGTVNYTITVPEGAQAPGTHYSVLFFETAIGTTVDEEGAQVLVAGRLGSLIYVDIAGTVDRTASIDKLDIRPGEGNEPMTFDITFSNKGNTLIALECEFIVFDKSGNVKGRGTLKPIYTREGMVVDYQDSWASRLAPGTYDFVFTFDLGEGQVLVEERQVVIE